VTAVAALTRTRKLIPRWFGHGDLTLVVDGDQVYARADQVEKLAGIPPWSTGETLLGDTWPLEIDGYPYYHLDDAIVRAEAVATPEATDFLRWLREQLPLILADEVLDIAQRIPPFIGSYPVSTAARLLSEDPAVVIGQNGLFAHMCQLGWIVRAITVTPDAPDWHITDTARRNGWLTVRDVIVPAANRARRRVYPQIYVTPAGLTELARTLHALHPDRDPQTPPHPQLFD
jgi:hypothetical protein